MMGLFESFEKITPKQWKQRIQFELAGLDYNKTLVSEIESLQVQPFYSKEDIPLKNQQLASNFNWLKLTCNPNCLKYADGLYSKNITDTYTGNKNIFTEIQKFPLKLSNKNRTYVYDLFGTLESNGQWVEDNKEHSFKRFRDYLQSSESYKILVDGTLYQNAGANCIEQIGLMMVKANEYITQFGIEHADKIIFKVAIGSNYLFEIAKLKALRLLWNLILNEYEVTEKNAFIIAENTLRNKPESDKENNLIRTILEASSAIQGGCNALLLKLSRFDCLHNRLDEHLIKQQLLLEKESYFHFFNYPISGSYALENLVTQICEKALDLFKNFEQKGGYLINLFNHQIQEIIEKSHLKELVAFNEKRLVLVGANKYKSDSSNLKKPYKQAEIKQKNDFLFPIIEAKTLY